MFSVISVLGLAVEDRPKLPLFWGLWWSHDCLTDSPPFCFFALIDCQLVHRTPPHLKICTFSKPMDSDTKRRVEEKVREILGTADMDTVTELKVRELAADSLGVVLSDIDSKKLVRGVVEAYLLSVCDDDHHQIRVHGDGSDCKQNTNGNLAGGGLEEGEKNANSILVSGESKEYEKPSSKASELVNGGGDIPANSSGIRFLCKLSRKRSVAIKDSEGEKVVLVGEFLWKDGKRVLGSKGIGLTAEQWLTFRKSFLAIEEAVKKVESRVRCEVEQKQIERDDKSEPHAASADIRHEPEFKKQKKSNILPAAQAPSTPRTLNPIEIVRFDGKNYQDWARRMELFLEQLNLAYVLSEPFPTAVGANTHEIPQVLAAAQKWMDDDYMCRTNILSSLSDHLFVVYSKKAGTTAKELWDELKLVYLTEEQGSKVSLVKKYMEFQMVEGKSVVAQVQELHELADSLDPHGMHVEECFHVNAIISKLPASWKDVGVKLMKENNLPVWMLMNSLKQEEELRRRGKRGAFPDVTVDDSEPNRGRRGLQPSYNIRLGGLPPYFAPDRERKVLFCTICQKKGHLEEKCWFKNNKPERGKSTTIAPEVEDRGTK